MFFLVTDTYQASRSYLTERWLTERCNGNGLWLGDGLEDQLLFSVTNRRYGGGTEKRTGFLINRGEVERMRYVTADGMEEAEDEE